MIRRLWKIERKVGVIEFCVSFVRFVLNYESRNFESDKKETLKTTRRTIKCTSLLQFIHDYLRIAKLEQIQVEITQESMWKLIEWKMLFEQIY